MATTGTYAFNPSAADVVLNAFGMIGLRRTQLNTEHLTDAAFAANMLGVEFTNRNPNRWQMEEVAIPLVADTSSYNLPPETVAISVVGLDQTVGDNTISRVLGPLSAADYASLPSKTQTGSPTSYFFSLLTPIPTLTLWPVPDGVIAYTMRVQTFKQQQDTSLIGGATVNTPYRFLDAFTHGLAARLAVYYPNEKRPNLDDKLNALFAQKFALAASLDQERVPLRVRPNMSSYYRR